MIYDNLLEVSDKYDTFLFDAYGVFWEGRGFYSNSREVMAELVTQGKKVVVISNTTRLQQDIIKSYQEKGLLPQRDYTHFFTSGDLLKNRLQRGELSFAQCANPRKYYVIGLPHKKAFANTIYQQVAAPEEADFVYCGVPFMYAADIAKYPQYAEQYWPARLDENGQVYLWDTLTEKPFVEIIKRVIDLGLPALNANPDFVAKEGHPLVKNAPAVFVVRNGTIAEMLRQGGAEVLEFGKPHENIYEYVFQELQKQGVTIDKTRTCMIGDTIRTDVKGAVNAGIDPILCVETGVTAEELLQGQSLESICAREKVDVQQIVKIKSVGGNDGI